MGEPYVSYCVYKRTPSPSVNPPLPSSPSSLLPFLTLLSLSLQVYTVNIENDNEVKAAIKKALSANFSPYLPYEFTQLVISSKHFGKL